jgi:hypothetical protein
VALTDAFGSKKSRWSNRRCGQLIDENAQLQGGYAVRPLGSAIRALLEPVPRRAVRSRSAVSPWVAPTLSLGRRATSTRGEILAVSWSAVAWGPPSVVSM